MTLDELRNLVRSKATVAAAHGGAAKAAIVRSAAKEARHKRADGACWAMRGACADLRGSRPICTDSHDPRCER